MSFLSILKFSTDDYWTSMVRVNESAFLSQSDCSVQTDITYLGSTNWNEWKQEEQCILITKDQRLGRTSGCQTTASFFCQNATGRRFRDSMFDLVT